MEETGGVNLSDLLLGTLGTGGIIWAIYEKLMRHRVQAANIDSNVATANASEALFTMLTTRLTSLEEEVGKLRKDLDKEREYTRLLMRTMMEANLTPPPYPL